MENGVWSPEEKRFKLDNQFGWIVILQQHPRVGVGYCKCFSVYSPDLL